MWIRLYDEAHNPKNYRTILPEGDYGDFVKNKSGSPSNVGWGGLGEIAKAVKMYQSGGDMRIISPSLGNMHKVRNFYNNIEVPNYKRFGDVTADTHQVAAAQLRPLSGSSTAVSHNLATGLGKSKQPEGYRGAKSSAVTGVQGTYGLVADATRLAAEELGLIPRAAQSATWEPVRELFTAPFKAQSKNVKMIDDIWRAYDAGTISIDEARQQILKAAGGIKEPSWAKSGSPVFDPRKSSTYR